MSGDLMRAAMMRVFVVAAAVACTAAAPRKAQTVKLRAAACARVAGVRDRTEIPMFASPERTGVYAATGVRTKPKVKWMFETRGGVYTTPVVRGEVVYVGHYSGVDCVKLSDGKRVWHSDATVHEHGSPTEANGLVYAVGWRIPRSARGPASLFALHADSGSESWEFKTKGSGVSAPTVVDGTVYFGTSDGLFFAIDAETGKELWETGGSRGSQACRPVATSKVVLTLRKRVACFDRTKGLEKWIEPEKVEMDAAHEPMGYGPRMRAFSCIAGGRFYAARIGDDRKDHYLSCAGVRKCKIYWDFRAAAGIQMTPVVAGGIVYVGDVGPESGVSYRGRGGRAKKPSAPTLYALDAKSGRPKWRYEARAGMWHSPVVGAGTLYIGDRSGRLYALDARTGEPLWMHNPWGNAYFGSAAVADGLVLVGTNTGQLWALGPMEK